MRERARKISWRPFCGCLIKNAVSLLFSLSQGCFYYVIYCLKPLFSNCAGKPYHETQSFCCFGDIIYKTYILDVNGSDSGDWLISKRQSAKFGSLLWVTQRLCAAALFFILMETDDSHSLRNFHIHFSINIVTHRNWNSMARPCRLSEIALGQNTQIPFSKWQKKKLAATWAE
jgi:hypothetical protein